MRQTIKSPINYTGNKYRLLSQFDKHMPKRTRVFVDLFCGGATVGFNIEADKVILIDNNQRIIDLLKYLASEDIAKIILAVENNIEKYKLSYSYKHTYKYYRDLGIVSGNNGLKKYNLTGYTKLKKDYNALKQKNTPTANSMLYTLMAYAFNNDIRFNRNGEFNLPAGKTDFNKNNYNKLIDFNKRAKEIQYEFICGDFKDTGIQKIILDADFIYCDPPYIITDAFYNEQGGWSINDEKELLSLLSRANEKKIKFALSNILRKEGAENSTLIEWIAKNGYQVNKIKYHYRSSSYNKKNRNSNEEEVLITNRITNATENF